MTKYYILHIPTGKYVEILALTKEQAEITLKEADFYFSKNSGKLNNNLNYTFYKHFLYRRNYIPRNENEFLLSIVETDKSE